MTAGEIFRLSLCRHLTFYTSFPQSPHFYISFPCVSPSFPQSPASAHHSHNPLHLHIIPTIPCFCTSFPQSSASVHRSHNPLHLHILPTIPCICTSFSQSPASPHHSHNPLHLHILPTIPWILHFPHNPFRFEMKVILATCLTPPLYTFNWLLNSSCRGYFSEAFTSA